RLRRQKIGWFHLLLSLASVKALPRRWVRYFSRSQLTHSAGSNLKVRFASLKCGKPARSKLSTVLEETFNVTAKSRFFNKTGPGSE
ncbi:MAG TPA: hypothetical protein PLW35_01760, partial [Verrucomicrobiota bacterium]|nr:hypothetical protein [Verrucomicrobiota bacterium]